MDYQQQQTVNIDAFRELIKHARPEIFMIMNLLDDLNVNPSIIFKYIYHLHDVGQNGYGSVNTQIENGIVTFIRGEKSDRLNEPISMEGSRDGQT